MVRSCSIDVCDCAMCCGVCCAGVVLKQKGGTSGKRFLDLPSWMMAWDAYALAAAAVDQMTFQSAILHKAVVMKIACGSSSERREHLLGPIYDQLVRYIGALSLPLVMSWALPFVVSGSIGRTKVPSWVMSSTSMLLSSVRMLIFWITPERLWKDC